ncbi:unnamed protein product [Amoebophrya sp. A120]|nr:unnamed protein product [Amoebophrya sp. A120]|eukprot:GSA120T00016275001.1
MQPPDVPIEDSSGRGSDDSASSRSSEDGAGSGEGREDAAAQSETSSSEEEEEEHEGDHDGHTLSSSDKNSAADSIASEEESSSSALDHQEENEDGEQGEDVPARSIGSEEDEDASGSGGGHDGSDAGGDVDAEAVARTSQSSSSDGKNGQVNAAAGDHSDGSSSSPDEADQNSDVVDNGASSLAREQERSDDNGSAAAAAAASDGENDKGAGAAEIAQHEDEIRDDSEKSASSYVLAGSVKDEQEPDPNDENAVPAAGQEVLTDANNVVPAVLLPSCRQCANPKAHVKHTCGKEHKFTWKRRPKNAESTNVTSDRNNSRKLLGPNAAGDKDDVNRNFSENNNNHPSSEDDDLDPHNSIMPLENLDFIADSYLRKRKLTKRNKERGPYYAKFKLSINWKSKCRFKNLDEKFNDTHCTQCGKEGGELIFCDGRNCTRSFHLPCVSRNQGFQDLTGQEWLCPYCGGKDELVVYNRGMQNKRSAHQKANEYFKMAEQDSAFKLKVEKLVRNCSIASKASCLVVQNCFPDLFDGKPMEEFDVDDEDWCEQIKKIQARFHELLSNATSSDSGITPLGAVLQAQAEKPDNVWPLEIAKILFANGCSPWSKVADNSVIVGNVLNPEETGVAFVQRQMIHVVRKYLATCEKNKPVIVAKDVLENNGFLLNGTGGGSGQQGLYFQQMQMMNSTDFNMLDPQMWSNLVHHPKTDQHQQHQPMTNHNVVAPNLYPPNGNPRPQANLGRRNPRRNNSKQTDQAPQLAEPPKMSERAQRHLLRRIRSTQNSPKNNAGGKNNKSGPLLRRNTTTGGPGTLQIGTTSKASSSTSLLVNGEVLNLRDAAANALKKRRILKRQDGVEVGEESKDASQVGQQYKIHPEQTSTKLVQHPLFPGGAPADSHPANSAVVGRGAVVGVAGSSNLLPEKDPKLFANDSNASFAPKIDHEKTSNAAGANADQPPTTPKPHLLFSVYPDENVNDSVNAGTTTCTWTSRFMKHTAGQAVEQAVQVMQPSVHETMWEKQVEYRNASKSSGVGSGNENGCSSSSASSSSARRGGGGATGTNQRNASQKNINAAFLYNNNSRGNSKNSGPLGMIPSKTSSAGTARTTYSRSHSSVVLAPSFSPNAGRTKDVAVEREIGSLFHPAPRAPSAEQEEQGLVVAPANKLARPALKTAEGKNKTTAEVAASAGRVPPERKTLPQRKAKQQAKLKQETLLPPEDEEEDSDSDFDAEEPAERDDSEDSSSEGNEENSSSEEDDSSSNNSQSSEKEEVGERRPQGEGAGSSSRQIIKQEPKNPVLVPEQAGLTEGQKLKLPIGSAVSSKNNEPNTKKTGSSRGPPDMKNLLLGPRVPIEPGRTMSIATLLRAKTFFRKRKSTGSSVLSSRRRRETNEKGNNCKEGSNIKQARDEVQDDIKARTTDKPEAKMMTSSNAKPATASRNQPTTSRSLEQNPAGGGKKSSTSLLLLQPPGTSTVVAGGGPNANATGKSQTSSSLPTIHYELRWPKLLGIEDQFLDDTAIPHAEVINTMTSDEQISSASSGMENNNSSSFGNLNFVFGPRNFFQPGTVGTGANYNPSGSTSSSRAFPPFADPFVNPFGGGQQRKNQQPNYDKHQCDSFVFFATNNSSDNKNLNAPASTSSWINADHQTPRANMMTNNQDPPDANASSRLVIEQDRNKNFIITQGEYRNQIVSDPTTKRQLYVWGEFLSLFYQADPVLVSTVLHKHSFPYLPEQTRKDACWARRKWLLFLAEASEWPGFKKNVTSNACVYLKERQNSLLDVLIRKMPEEILTQVVRFL